MWTQSREIAILTISVKGSAMSKFNTKHTTMRALIIYDSLNFATKPSAMHSAEG
jgi:hypothetical protein